MLTDIFAERYAERPIWKSIDDKDLRLLVQASKMLREQLYPVRDAQNNEIAHANAMWNFIHKRMCMELGLESLGPLGRWVGVSPHQSWYPYPMDSVCGAFLCAKFDGTIGADRFMKERLSLVELAFRDRETEVKVANSEFPKQLNNATLYDKTVVHLKAGASRAEQAKAANEWLNSSFKANVYELNERLKRAGMKLNYHNGFIQVAEDPLIEAEIETPFWAAIAAPRWKNVDWEMKNAIDKRDSGDRDSAFCAARALESTIKIISDEKRWTHGGEKGAHGYIDNLASTKNGAFIDKWEQDSLKDFFTKVRNPLGHGAGVGKMPELTPQQTSWAIEFCMSWIKSLVRRMGP